MSVGELKLNIRHAQENIENKSYQIKMWNERIERYNQKLKELAYKQETVKNFYISKINKILLMAAKALNCYGSVIQYEKMVTVSHLSGNETSNIIDLALYNEYSEGPEITQEQLDSEFVALMSGECTYSECVSIDAIQTFNRASGHGGEEHPIKRYEEYITLFLNEKYNINFSEQATSEQLQEAAQYAAERWHEDENEIYENRK